MRISVAALGILMISGGVLSARPGAGQSLMEKKVSVTIEPGALAAGLQKIRDAAHVNFAYSARDLAQLTTGARRFVNEPLGDVLAGLLRHTGLAFKESNHIIIIYKKQLPVPVPDQAAPRALIVSGTVADEHGRPLVGVTIRNKNTNQGTVTDAEGKYRLRATTGDVLIVSYIGYETKNIRVGNSGHIDIVLRPGSNKLNEAVVIGYGSMLKKDLTGSVSTVAAKDIEDIPFMTADNALAGKVAGVQVTKSDGTPGGAVRIRVRGSTSLLGGNEPLYVIDGVPVQVKSNYINPGFDFINPTANDVSGGAGVSAGISTAFINGLNSIGGLNVDDIESITVLKDAAATAIYGSKAANGVIIITTKKGKKDMKPRIMFSYYGTYTEPITPTLLNGDQYKMLLSEAARNDYNYKMATGQSYLISPVLDAIVNSPDTYFGKANTDWLDLVTRNTYSNNAEISVQGGGSASRYYSAISYNNTPGVVRGSNYQRIAGKLNLENEIGKHLRFITNINMGYVTQDITDGAYSQALRARPDYVPYDSAGNFTDFSKVGASYQGYQNPLALLTAINNSKTFSLLGSVSGIYDFSPALEFKSTVSLNMQNYSQRNYTPSYVAIGAGLYLGNMPNNGGIGGNSNSRMTNWFMENTLTYNKMFGAKHSLNILAGTSYETNKTSFFSVTAEGYPNDNILNSLSSAVTPLYTKGDDPSKPQSYLVSYYMRANYGFMDKYLFTFTGRADGSSKFGPENKFGFFPSGAVAWRISRENFLKDVSWIDDIKLRGSYGVTGTQNIGDQMYRTLYTPYAYAGSSALVPAQLGNPRIKWETTDETDAGLDFSFFKERLQGTFDYYKKQTNNALLSLPIAPSSSYSTLLGNVAGIRNTGYEFSLQGDIIRTKNFRWNASFNITWNKSLVTKLSADADLGQIGNLTGLELGNTALIEGKPLGLITGIAKVTGIIKTQKQLDAYKEALGGYAGFLGAYLALGDPMYALDSSDGFGRYPIISPIIGHAAPDYYGGFTQEFGYKNFDLSFYFTFQEGGELMWGDHISSINFTSTANANAIALKRYTSQNTSSNQPRLLLYDQMFLNNTNLSVFNSSYIKLRTLTFNYRFNQPVWMTKAGIQNASVFLSATNLFTITSYPGNDPETSDDPYSVAGGYFDVSNYPTVRTFSAGLKVSF